MISSAFGKRNRRGLGGNQRLKLGKRPVKRVAFGGVVAEKLLDLVVVFGPERGRMETPERMGRAIGSNPRKVLAKLLQPRHRILERRGIHPRRREVIEFLDQGRVFAQREPSPLGAPEHLMDRQAHGVAEHCLHGVGVGTKLRMAAFLLAEGVVELRHGRGPHRIPRGEMGEKLLLVGLRAVQLQHEVAKARAGESRFHHLEGREFLGHEQHLLAFADGCCDEIGDGLRFAGAGRAFDHAAMAVENIDERAVLGTVGVVHQRQVAAWVVVDGVFFGVPTAVPIRLAAEQLLNERMVFEGVVGPALWLEFPQQEHVREREQRQGHHPPHPPPRHVFHGLCHSGQVGGRCLLRLRVVFRQLEFVVVEIQLLAERQIGREFLACGRDVEPRERHAFGALDGDGNGEERREPERLPARPIRVFEEADDEMEHVASRLLDGEPRLAVELAAMRAELIGVEQRLQPGRLGRRIGSRGGHVEVVAAADAAALGELPVVGPSRATGNFYVLALGRLRQREERHPSAIGHQGVERGIDVRMDELDRLGRCVLEVQQPVATVEDKKRVS